MTQEEKQLLVKDLCSRLPYSVKCSFGVDDAVYEIIGINPTCCGAYEIQATHIKSSINGDFRLNSCKPYLFPLSSMTDEQKEEYCKLQEKVIYNSKGLVNSDVMEYVNWCYKNHIDINGLIPMGLAIDATGLNIYQIWKIKTQQNY